MELKELYAMLGELTVQSEVIQARTLEVKKKIAEKLNSGRGEAAGQKPELKAS